MTRLISEDVLAIVTIYQEARGESYEGKVAVAEVIRNRMTRKYSSDGTVSGTVLRPYQFSGFNTQDPNRIPSFRLDSDDPVVRECQRAWDAAKDGSETVKGAVLYLNEAVISLKPSWANINRLLVKIGNHSFYH